MCECQGVGCELCQHDPGPAPAPIDKRIEDVSTVLSCCRNEKRNMNGGCDNCGDPCY